MSQEKHDAPVPCKTHDGPSLFPPLPTTAPPEEISRDEIKSFSHATAITCKQPKVWAQGSKMMLGQTHGAARQYTGYAHKPSKCTGRLHICPLPDSCKGQDGSLLAYRVMLSALSPARTSPCANVLWWWSCLSAWAHLCCSACRWTGPGSRACSCGAAASAAP